MRPEQRPRVSAVARVEHDLRSLPWSGGPELGPDMGVLRLAEVDRRAGGTALDPVPHRGVLWVGRDALRRELALDQALKRDLSVRIGEIRLIDDGLASDHVADQA